MELQEKDFIREDYKKHPASFWGWLIFCFIVFMGFWWFTGQVEQKIERAMGSQPFYQVTNRQFSLFLWQNPGFMKKNLKGGRDYLPAWGDRLTVDPEEADKWVEATPTALFMYHTWDRLVGAYVYSRRIPQEDFLRFLESDPQWDPKYWKQAPTPYSTLLNWIREGNQYDDLKELSYKELPLIVRQAFIGWKNYTQESEEINTLAPTWRQVWSFLELYPHFKRPFWINFLREEAPLYLKSEEAQGQDTVPEDRLAGLLKVALYNYLKEQH